MKNLISILFSVGLILMAFAASPVQATNGSSRVMQTVGEQCFVRLTQTDNLPKTVLPLRELDVPSYPYTLQLEGWPAMTGSNSSLLLAQDNVPEIEVRFDPAKMTASMRNSSDQTKETEWAHGFLELGLRCPSGNQSLFLGFNGKEQRWTAFVP